jgi:hypothetical protein
MLWLLAASAVAVENGSMSRLWYGLGQLCSNLVLMIMMMVMTKRVGRGE